MHFACPACEWIKIRVRRRRANRTAAGQAARNAMTLPDVKKISTGDFKSAAPSRELDGHAGDRIAEHLTEWLLSTALVEQLVRN